MPDQTATEKPGEPGEPGESGKPPASPGKPRARVGTHGRVVIALAVGAAALGVAGVVLLVLPHDQSHAPDLGSATTVHQPDQQPHVVSSEVPTTTPAVPTEDLTGSEATLEDDDLAEVEQLWRTVAEGFARDHARPGPDWHQRVSQWTSPYLAEQLSRTSPQRIPTSTLVDVESTSVGAYFVEAIATYTDGRQLRIELEVDPGLGGFRVVDFYEVDD